MNYENTLMELFQTDLHSRLDKVFAGMNPDITEWELQQRFRSNGLSGGARPVDVSVMFAEISGLAPAPGERGSAEDLQISNELYKRFDALLKENGLQQIETLGEQFVVVSGLPDPKQDHAKVLAELAINMQEAAARLKFSTGVPLSIRFGFSSGIVITGVVDRKNFIYDFSGNVFNSAVRLERFGENGDILVTTQTYSKLKEDYDFEFNRYMAAVDNEKKRDTWALVGRKEQSIEISAMLGEL